MKTLQRTYRGIPYSPFDHEQASGSYVEHIYRGKRYEAPLNHGPSNPNNSIELHYRGTVYQHRQKDV